MIDSHCHLAGAEFTRDLEAVVARAKAAGLVRCLVILGAEDDEEVAQAAVVARAWPEVKFAVGVHPHNAGRFAHDPEAAASMTASRVDAMSSIAAIGDIGLDYHYDFAPRDVQQAVFRAQLRLARTRALPVVVHTREADDDTLRLLGEESAGELRGVFHCFTGDMPALQRRLETAFHVSIPGVATFPKLTELREAARHVPEDRLLIETDSPYLAPVPFRGKRNEPAHVMKTLELLAELRQTPAEMLGRRLVRNFDALFGPA